jgi:hypothetical protein
MAAQANERAKGDKENGAPKSDGSPAPSKRDAEDASRSPPPPAGPHADPSLTNDEATPGAGTLPPPDGEPGDGGSVSS